MKFGLTLISLLVCALAGTANASVFTMDQVQQLQVGTTQATMALINWKVGDSADMDVSLGGFGMNGTMHKEAFKEEGSGIWLRQQLSLPIMNDTSEVLYDRNTGKVLKYIHNGKEENIPDSKIEVVSEKAETVTVPAGTFKTLHIVAKSKDVKSIDVWMNNRDISLDGTAKMVMDQGQMTITMELTKFVKN